MTRSDSDHLGCLLDGPANPDHVRALVDEHGFALLRGTGVASNAEFRVLTERVVGPAITYQDASTPRSRADERVYTATEYPAELDIPLHNEQSYSRFAPRYIAFYCERPAERGGDTVLADSGAWLRAITPETRARFEAAGVLYVRNFYGWLTPSWQTVYETDSREEAAARCEQAGGHARWSGDALHTEQPGPAVIEHPRSGEPLWFNQAHLFHPFRLDADTREALEELYTPAELPRNALFGDGEPIPDVIAAEVLEAAERVAVDIALEAGDVLIADNLRVAHGRRSFTRDRRIFVTMSAPWPVPRG